MDEYVSKQEALEALNHLSYSSPHESQQSIARKKIYTETLELFIKQQDERAVNVIHCKDCKHYDNRMRFNWCKAYHCTHSENDFCSIGERIAIVNVI